MDNFNSSISMFKCFCSIVSNLLLRPLNYIFIPDTLFCSSRIYIDFVTVSVFLLGFRILSLIMNTIFFIFFSIVVIASLTSLPADSTFGFFSWSLWMFWCGYSGFCYFFQRILVILWQTVKSARTPATNSLSPAFDNSRISLPCLTGVWFLKPKGLMIFCVSFSLAELSSMPPISKGSSNI